MLTQDTCKFYDAHNVYDSYGGVVLAAEGERIANALSSRNGCILINHGLLMVGGFVGEAASLRKYGKVVSGALTGRSCCWEWNEEGSY